MTTISLAIILQTATLGATTHSYADARAKTSETGKPLVVLVGADWCPACQTMKNTAMPQVARRGALNKVAYAVVNTDQQSDLAHKLMRGGSIPQLVMYRETPTGWHRESLVGRKTRQRSKPSSAAAWRGSKRLRPPWAKPPGR